MQSSRLGIISLLFAFSAAAQVLNGCNELWGISEPIEPDEFEAGMEDAGAPLSDAAPDAASADAGHTPDASVALDASVPDADAAAAHDAESEGSVGEPPLEPACRRATKTVKDPTSRSWTTVWYCTNDPGAPIFEAADGRTQVAHMETTDSWFVCYRRGESHSGGNDVWYYTQGDKATTGWEARDGWGYMPASKVQAEAHPFARISECAASP